MSAADSVATHWRCGAVDLDLARTRLMGIVNVTPDSFSDGGLHETPSSAIAWGLQLLDDGADILDIGGESTRPGFTPVAPDEEIKRILPVIEALADTGALISVDTRHADVASAALAAGASIINDVSGLTDPAMVEVAAAYGCGCLVMHAGAGFLAGKALVSAELPSDPYAYVDYLTDYLLSRAADLEAAGIAADRIAFDPGAGFGTTPAQDIAVQQATDRLVHLGYPLVCAVSRKRFVGAISGAHPASARDAASLGVALTAAHQGARIIRVHDVRATAEALRAAEVCEGSAPAEQALIALGANLGDRIATLQTAVDAIAELPLTHLDAVSHIYETEPAYRADQPAFANAVCKITTQLHPLALLEAINAIEADMGRQRTVANGPRTLDLDLLWMEGERHAGGRLTLPHPSIGERAFVLQPLGDVVGDVRSFCEREGIRVADGSALVGSVIGELGILEDRS